MNKKDLKILYLGTPDISSKVLEKLIEAKYTIIAVISQPDKEVGRKHILTPTPVKCVAQKYGIEVYQPLKIKDIYEEIEKLSPDILLTMAYGQLIPDSVLALPKIKALNLHGSLLPKYRGASPIQAALMNGDEETGVTLMEMVHEMDAGNMFYKEVIKIDSKDNFDSLKNKISDAAFEAFDKGIDSIINDGYIGEKQDASKATFTKKINEEDQQIFFTDSAKNIVNKIRALTIEPGAYFVYKNEKIKVFEAEIINAENAVPGKVKMYDKNGLFIETKDGIVSIKCLQKPGKKPVSIKDFYNGNREYFKVNQIVE
ncbi:MAG: methionyl-tRNA formyltransferase [Bacilli bacterium]|nr:methionyl-tRNA formyltransferase [Bacilli bacterium]